MALSLLWQSDNSGRWGGKGAFPLPVAISISIECSIALPNKEGQPHLDAFYLLPHRPSFQIASGCR